MNHKIWIVFRREYLNIVKKKTFLISTFLVPLSFGLIFGIQILAALFVEKESHTVLVQEETPLLMSALTSSTSLKFEPNTLDDNALREKLLKDENLIVLRLPTQDILNREQGEPFIKLSASRNISDPVRKEIREKVTAAIKAYKRDRVGITEAQIKALDFELEVKTEKITAQGAKNINAGLAKGIGFGVCFLVYMLISIYGSILMQSIIDEKSNRIVEVIVSSVKPFQLLMGKVLAIASVALTQFLLWVLLSGGLMLILGIVAGGAIDPAAMQAQADMPGSGDAQQQAREILRAIDTFEWRILWFMPFYFIGGFFLYGSLMAAAASAVDNVQDAQQFVTPVTIFIILPMLFMVNIIQNPNGVFATFASIFPFFSPMIMMVRLALTEVPWYEVVASMAVLVLSFVGCIWLAGKIYRTGILMYGKKPSFKEIFKWVRY